LPFFLASFHSLPNQKFLFWKPTKATSVECHRGLWLDATHFFIYLFGYYFVIVDAASAAVFYLLYFWGKQLKGSGQLCRIVFRRTSSCQKNRQLLILFCF
jgi:hypothetical protein